MFLGFNKVIIIGYLGHNPEVRYTQSGIAVTTLNIAVSEQRKDEQGIKSYTDWFNVVCLGKPAENAGIYLKKGRQVFVEGKLQNRIWENKLGYKNIITEIITKQIIFLGNKDNNMPLHDKSKDEKITYRANKNNKEDIPF